MPSISSSRKLIDLTNRRFGRLVVIDIDHKKEDVIAWKPIDRV
jgi:hypothetical protein